MIKGDWKAAFAAEFARHIDHSSGSAAEITAWLDAEAEGAYRKDADPIEEAREAVSAIHMIS